MAVVQKIGLLVLLAFSGAFYGCQAMEVPNEIRSPITIHCENDNSNLQIPWAVASQLETVKNLVNDTQSCLVPLNAEYSAQTLRHLVEILNQEETARTQVLSTLNGGQLEKIFCLANFLAADSSFILLLDKQIKNKNVAVSPELKKVVQDASLAVSEAATVDSSGYLNLAGKNIASMHGFAHAQQTKKLDLRDNNIEVFEIPHTHLRTGIEEINVSGNGLQSLTQGSLCNLPPTLRRIDLCRNRIVNVEAGVSDGVQQGLVVDIGLNDLSAKLASRLKKEVETESNSFRYYRRLGAKIVSWACRPIASKLWLFPLNIALAARFGHTHTWKLCNIGMNGLAMYDAIRQRDVGQGVRLLLDSCQQFNGVTAVNDFLQAKFSMSPAGIISSRLYNKVWWASYLARFVTRGRPMLSAIGIQTFSLVDAAQFLAPATLKAQLGSIGFSWRRLFARQAGVASLVSFIHNRIDAWLKRTQNKVELH